ncbi:MULTISPECIES: hypothetical protein [unclassified Serratia (in: enterobacteria)]|uniref:hypothetical protein n=1 Tax=unclassified Serratia (in: enterobacteria) TaxID=2647522 RepID=UPI003076124C
MKRIWSILMHSENEIYVCQIGGSEQSDPLWGDDEKNMTFNIYDCCGVEFGYEDATLTGIKGYREKWLTSGVKWNSKKSKPED